MELNKIMVKICVGTACFVQGGADLLLYEDFLDRDLLGMCTIEGTSCLKCCKSDDQQWRAPFVEINGVVHSEVTQKRLVELLREAQYA